MAIKLCTEYDNLSTKERIILVGEIVHAIQSSGILFNMAIDIIEKGNELNVFEGVTILPNGIKSENDA